MKNQSLIINGFIIMLGFMYRIWCVGMYCKITNILPFLTLDREDAYFRWAEIEIKKGNRAMARLHELTK